MDTLNTFNDTKYTRWYLDIIYKAQKRASTKKAAKSICKYIETHHIIPESFFVSRTRKGPIGWLSGDPNVNDNIVYLTAKEHFICHHLLIHMCSGRALNIITYAFRGMCAWRSKTHTRYVVLSRWYEKSKILANSIPVSDETRAKNSTSNKGRITSEETKRKISESKTGIKHTAETIAKMVISQKNRSPEVLERLAQLSRTPERRKRSSEIHTGKIVSEETRQKISLARTGTTASDKARAKMSESRTGHLTSQETRDKQSASNKGQKRSEEAKENMRIGRLRAKEKKSNPD